MLAAWYPDYRVKVTGPSWLRVNVVLRWRAARRSRCATCSSERSRQHHPAYRTAAAIGSLMEKQSRVASWGYGRS
jgi:hypothetical protein